MPTHLPVEQVQALQAFYATRRQLAKRIEALSYDALELLRERGDQVSVPASLYDQGQLLEPCISKEVAELRKQLRSAQDELNYMEDLKNELEHQLLAANATLLELRQGGEA